MTTQLSFIKHARLCLIVYATMNEPPQSNWRPCRTLPALTRRARVFGFSKEWFDASLRFWPVDRDHRIGRVVAVWDHIDGAPESVLASVEVSKPIDTRSSSRQRVGMPGMMPPSGRRHLVWSERADSVRRIF
jgi:hypothetical protein